MTMEWQGIETAPTSGQFLATDWEPGDPWCTCIDVLVAPVMADGRILDQNSGNYTRFSAYTFWAPLPPPPVGE